MATYDVMPFFNELMILEMRMEILNPYVDFFVINEAPLTFTGNNKPLYFEENKSLFEKFKSKIIHNVIQGNNLAWNQWERELFQKGQLVSHLCNVLKDEDIIILSDTDEIPNLKDFDFDKAIQTNKLYIFNQLFYSYYFNTLACNGNVPFPWEGSRLSTWKLLKNHSTDSFRNPNSGFRLHSPNQIEFVPNGGWHFSFLNTPENVQLKIKSWSHQEFNNSFVQDNVASNMASLKDIFYRGQFEIKPIAISEETHPLYLLENYEKYEKFIFENNLFD